MKRTARRPRPTSVIACNDLVALGVMSGAGQMDLAVPDDLSVGGYDDIFLAEHAVPALTTVRRPIEEIGRWLARLLVQRLRNRAEPGGTEPDSVLLTPELIIRDSTGPPPDSPA